MDIIFELLGLLFVFLGILGSFLPVLPGPLTGWVGLFLLHQSDRVPQNIPFLTTTFVIAVAVFLIDYIIPALGTKKFGGSKKGIIGSTLGLLIGLVFGSVGNHYWPFPWGLSRRTTQQNRTKKSNPSSIRIFDRLCNRCVFKI